MPTEGHAGIVDIAVVGAGAAGLMAAIWAGRTRPGARIVALDGARSLGAKILVAGGGRCNVTHDEVSEADYAGSTPPAIRNVLRQFGVEATVGFFGELGVALKREDTGKLFPVSDRARDVLDALLRAATDVGVRLEFPRRVHTVERDGEGFVLRPAAGSEEAWPALRAQRVVLATGGRALPKSGSDGHGYEIARSLGHSITPHVFPALAPLVLADGHFLRELSGVAAPAIVEVRAGTGRRLASFEGPVLCTHFGLSGPAILDVSRHLTGARFADPGATLVLNWLPGRTGADLDSDLVNLGKSGVGRLLRERGLPDRLARALCDHAGVHPGDTGSHLAREARRALVRAVTELAVPVVGDRGFTHAEAAAGGIPLAEVRLQTMESRPTPGLHLCGEVCDVDGRVGGYNFQWAWASGYVAGTSAARVESLS